MFYVLEFLLYNGNQLQKVWVLLCVIRSFSISK